MTNPQRRPIDGPDGVVYSPRGEWGYYNRGHRVRVLSTRDPHHGSIGIVTGTYNDGGDMVHEVAFPDDHTADYLADELISARVGTRHSNTQLTEWN